MDEARALGSKHPEAAFLLARSVLEGAARLVLYSRPVSKSALHLRLLKTLYSLGGLSKADHEWVQRAAEVRSRLVHGLRSDVPANATARVTEIAMALLTQEDVDFDAENDSA